MEQTFVTEREFNISNQRIADENQRQNERINMLEANYAVVQQLAVQMERLATNMETMAKELTRQGTKLNELEMKPSKRWDLIVTSLITGVVGAIVGMAMKGWIV
jgi:spore germination protein YaaH